MRKSNWCLCIGISLFFLVLITSIALIATAPTTQDGDNGDVFYCVDAEEGNDLACDVGEEEEGPLPFVEDVAEEDGVVVSAQQDDPLVYKGASLSGGEIIGDVDGSFVPDDNNAQIFIYKGMNTFRIPFVWENIALKDGTLLNNGYIKELDTVIASLIEKRASVVLVLYNYMQYGNTGIIAEGVNAPTLNDVTRLWLNVATRYIAPKMIYAIMNEGGNASSLAIQRYTETAINAIRTAERNYGLTRPHYVQVFGTDRNQILTWFCSPNHLTQALVKDPASTYIQVVYQYFDVGMTGLYSSGDCMTLQQFKQAFDFQFDQFVGWLRNNKQRAFVAQFGAPDTPNCIAVVSYFLDLIKNNAYNKVESHGFLGWSIWSGLGDTRSSPAISISPGGQANNLLWGNNLYENYLTALSVSIPTFRELQRRAIQITNNSPEKLVYQDGYVPYQFRGSANIAANGGVGYLYSNVNINTPTGNIRIRYTLGASINTVVAIGLFQVNSPTFQVKSGLENRDMTPPRYRWTIVRECFIAAAGPNALNGEPRCYAVTPSS